MDNNQRNIDLLVSMRLCEFWGIKSIVPLATLSEIFSCCRIVIPSRRLNMRRGHSPLDCGTESIRPVAFRAEAGKSHRMLTGGSLGSHSHASGPPSLPPRPPGGFDEHQDCSARASIALQRLPCTLTCGFEVVAGLDDAVCHALLGLFQIRARVVAFFVAHFAVNF